MRSASTNTETLLEAHFSGVQAERFGVGLAAVVQQRGEVVVEQYGTDPISGKPAGPETTLISWSMAKSFTQALVGMLVLDGLLNVDEPAPIKQWAGDARREITLRHLLTMTSGLEFNEDYVDAETSHCIEMLFGDGAEDTAGYAAAMPLLHRPGTVFNYSSGTTNIISSICRDALGGGPALASYIQQRLFDPLGMRFATAKADAAGTFVGSSFVYATAREFATFGQLYLQDGIWNGQRLLPEGWVADARRPVDVEVPEDFHYGAQWWLWDEPKAFAAHGFEGQYLLVIPESELVLVRLGKSPTDEQKSATHQWLRDLAKSVSDN